MEIILPSVSIQPRKVEPLLAVAVSSTPSVPLTICVVPFSIATPPAVTEPSALSNATVTLEFSFTVTNVILLIVNVAVVPDKPLLDSKAIEMELPASKITL